MEQIKAFLTSRLVVLTPAKRCDPKNIALLHPKLTNPPIRRIPLNLLFKYIYHTKSRDSMLLYNENLVIIAWIVLSQYTRVRQQRIYYDDSQTWRRCGNDPAKNRPILAKLWPHNIIGMFFDSHCANILCSYVVIQEIAGSSFNHDTIHIYVGPYNCVTDKWNRSFYI